MALGLHQLLAGEPQLDARPRVDDVVDAAVERMETPEEGRVGGVDDAAGREGGDVPLPEAEVIPNGGEGAGVGNPSGVPLLPQIGVLHREEFFAHRLRRADIHQGAEQVLLPLFVRRDFHPGKPPVFRQQIPD